MSIGGGDTCAIDDDKLWCWGLNSGGSGDILSGQSSAIPTPQTVISGSLSEIATGFGTNCVVKAGGTAWCWGSEDHGSLGDGLNQNSASPVAVTDLSSGVVHIIAQYNEFYVLKDDGTVWGWGDISGANLSQIFLQDPLARRYGSKVPLQIVGLDTSPVRQLSGHKPWTCALDAAAQIRCWGNLPAKSGFERHGVDEAVRLLIGGRPDLIIASISVGGDMLCVLDNDGAISCLGPNDAGQLGDGTTDERLEVGANVILPKPARAVTGGMRHACAVLTDDTLWCWGSNSSGQLGATNGTMATRPIQVRFGG